MHSSLLTAFCLLSILGLAAGDDDPKADKGKTDPSGVPLEAVLTSKEASYKLDLGGKTADDVRKMHRRGRLPAAARRRSELGAAQHGRQGSCKSA